VASLEQPVSQTLSVKFFPFLYAFVSGVANFGTFSMLLRSIEMKQLYIPLTNTDSLRLMRPVRHYRFFIQSQQVIVGMIGLQLDT
jgi:hypothetical protein